MAGVALGLLGREVAGRAGAGAGRAEAAGKILEQRGVAGEAAGVQQRGADGVVAVGLGQAVRHRARGVADLEAEIPQEIQHELDHKLRRLRGRDGGEEQQVDVRERRQQAAPVLKVTTKSFGTGRRFPIAVKVQV